MEFDSAPPAQPIATEETIEAISRLHADHRASATRHERVVDSVTSLLGRPSFLASLSVFVAAWMLLNLEAPLWGFRAPDPAPYAGLSCVASLSSLYFVILVLTTQRRAESLSRRRELLSLELMILSEQKITKVVGLLEELRRDSPAIQNRIDGQADAMARPTDPQSVIDAIKEARSAATPKRRNGDSE